MPKGFEEAVQQPYTGETIPVPPEDLRSLQDQLFYLQVPMAKGGDSFSTSDAPYHSGMYHAAQAGEDIIGQHPIWQDKNTLDPVQINKDLYNSILDLVKRGQEAQAPYFKAPIDESEVQQLPSFDWNMQ